MNGTDSNESFHKGVIKVCVMEKPTEKTLLEYARFNRCPRCDAPRLEALGELKTERGPIGILVCRECEFGVYVESNVAAPDSTIDPEQMQRLLDKTQEILDEDLQAELRKFCAVVAQSHNENLQAKNERLTDDLAHFGEMLEAVQGGEAFGDLVLRLLKDRDRCRRAISFAMCTIRSGEDMTPEAEKIFTEALGSYSPLTFTVSCLGLLTDTPDELVVGARILARALDKPVYLTRAVAHGAVLLSWTITIDRDKHGSEVRIDPNGSAHEMDTYT